MVDLAILGVLLVLMLLGMRRGFFRELVGATALVGATVAASRWAPAFGSGLAESLETSVQVGYLAAGVLIWSGTYLVIQLAGRALFARLKRAPSEEKDLGDAARGAVASYFRTTDIVLGAALGLAKGALVATLVLYVAVDLRVPQLERFLLGTTAAAAYRDTVAPFAAQRIPEVQIARSFGTVRQIAATLEKHPERYERVASHPALRDLSTFAPVLAIVEDPECRESFANRRLDQVLRHPKVIALVRDREAMRRIAAIDVAGIHAAIERDAPPAYLYPDPRDQHATVPVDGGEADPRFPQHKAVTGQVAFASEEGVILTLAADADGLIRTHDLSWTSLEVAPELLFPVGTTVRARVLETDHEPDGKLHLALGRRQLADDPWSAGFVPARLPPRSQHNAKVQVVSATHVIVELDGGVEATIPLEEIAASRRASLAPGQTVITRVLEVDALRRTIRVRPSDEDRHLSSREPDPSGS